MKTIGIILREFNANYRNIGLYGIGRDIIKMLRKYDVNAICIPVIYQDEEKELNVVKKSIDMCQGIVFPGGLDEWKMDYELVKYCYEINKPTLGICLGMQLIGKTFNGNIEGIGDERHNILDEYVHKVNIEKDSKLFQIIQKEEIVVNSRHNNNVTKTDLKCSAYSEDGIIEAVEDKSKTFFIGVQWHPESIMEDENSKKLFDYFVKCVENN